MTQSGCSPGGAQGSDLANRLSLGTGVLLPRRASRAFARPRPGALGPGSASAVSTRGCVRRNAATRFHPFGDVPFGKNSLHDGHQRSPVTYLRDFIPCPQTVLPRAGSYTGVCPAQPADHHVPQRVDHAHPPPPRPGPRPYPRGNAAPPTPLPLSPKPRQPAHAQRPRPDEPRPAPSRPVPHQRPGLHAPPQPARPCSAIRCAPRQTPHGQPSRPHATAQRTGPPRLAKGPAPPAPRSHARSTPVQPRPPRSYAPLSAPAPARAFTATPPASNASAASPARWSGVCCSTIHFFPAASQGTFRLKEMVGLGWTLLGEPPGVEMVLGQVSRPWKSIAAPIDAPTTPSSSTASVSRATPRSPSA